jgi:hypothetical protein
MHGLFAEGRREEGNHTTQIRMSPSLRRPLRSARAGNGERELTKLTPLFSVGSAKSRPFLGGCQGDAEEQDASGSLNVKKFTIAG